MYTPGLPTKSVLYPGKLREVPSFIMPVTAHLLGSGGRDRGTLVDLVPRNYFIIFKVRMFMIPHLRILQFMYF